MQHRPVLPRPPCLFTVILLVTAAQSAAASEPPIHYATREGNVAVVRRILDANPSQVRAEWEGGNEPLHVAARFGRLEVARLLLDRGADPNAPGWNQDPPLIMAVGANRREIAELLVDCGADPLWMPKDAPAKGPARSPVLFGAARMGSSELVKRMLEAKVDPEGGASVYDLTPLHLAAAEGHLDVVRLLVDAGADVNARQAALADFIGGMNKSFNGLQTPLLLATSNNHTDVAKFLLGRGARVDVWNQFGASPLDHACWHANVELVKLLISKGAVLNPKLERKAPDVPEVEPGFHRARVAQPLPPLFGAAERADPATLEALLKAGADVTTRAADSTALHRLLDDVHDGPRSAALWVEAHVPLSRRPDPGEKIKPGDREASVKLLLDAGADPRARDAAGHTPLYYALKNAAKTGVADVLRSRGAKLNVFDAVALDDLTALKSILKEDPKVARETTPGGPAGMGTTPLHLAATAGRSEAARMLAEAGADVNARAAYDRTPLHLAAIARSGATLRALVDAGANVATADKNQQTAFSFILQNWDSRVTPDPRWQAEAVETLLRRRSDLGDDGYRSALLCCVGPGWVLVKRVLEHRGNTSLDAPEGRKMLAIAASIGDEASVRMLLAAGANPNAGRDIPQWMPLHSALHARDLDVLRLLVEQGADLNATDTQDGRTPLHHAIGLRRTEAVRFLASRGADLTIKDKKGRTPVDLARAHPEGPRAGLLSALGVRP